MPFGNMFGNLSGGQLNSALQKTGSNFQLPANPYVDDAASVGGPEVESAIAKSKGGQGGGMLGQVQAGLGALGSLGGGGQQQPAPQSSGLGGQWAEGARDIGDENQKKAMGKLGALIGAVGSFYTGNYAGMASGVKGLSG